MKPHASKASRLERALLWALTTSLWITGTGNGLMNCMEGATEYRSVEGCNTVEVKAEVSFLMQECDAGRGPHLDIPAGHSPLKVKAVYLGQARSDPARCGSTYLMFFNYFKVVSRGPRWAIL
ncbi:MAG: hypothetical protein OSA43_11865, partial [Pirellulales bacterium]|nr:hypothetical protein [Pirellulales bacterium]